MTTREFIKIFDTIAEAPGGVDRLRELVLQLAVRGRLVPQDSDDEPTSKLVAELEAGKERLLRKKIITKSRYPCGISIEQKPFEVPETWQWFRMSDVGAIIRGVTYQKAQASETLSDTSIALLRAHNIQQRIEFDRLVYIPRNLVKKTRFLRQDDLLFCIASGSSSLVGKSARIEESLDATFGAFTAVLRPHDPIISRFLSLYCASPDGRTLLVGYGQGIGIKNLKTTALAALPVSVPPLAEQHRIVAKVNELMGLIDRLEQHLVAKGKYHEAFAAAAVYHL